LPIHILLAVQKKLVQNFSLLSIEGWLQQLMQFPNQYYARNNEKQTLFKQKAIKHILLFGYKILYSCNAQINSQL